MICDGPTFKLAHCGFRTKQSRAFLRLAHINKQLRREFLPIYHKSIRSVRYCDAVYFIRDFVLPRNNLAAVRTLTLDVGNVREDEARGPDMLPLLRLFKQHRDVTLAFSHRDSTKAAVLHRAFSED